MKDESDQVREWLRRNPGQEKEWLRQNSLIYSALIGVGVLMVQPFLTAGTLDLSARISVVGFAVAIPLLAALLMINHQETFVGRTTNSGLVGITKLTAQLAAFIGLVAAFWHIWWLAGAALLAGGILALAAYSAGYSYLDGGPGPGKESQPPDSGS